VSPAQRSELSAVSLGKILERYPPAPHYWIAYSGGLDSMVLLALCANLAKTQTSMRFAALHVHHGLQSCADTWVDHCHHWCQLLGIPLNVVWLDARAKSGQSPEETARKARYAALRQALRPGDVLLTAHHLDDQAETLLLQLLRGAGLAGMAAMPESAEFEPGLLIRPLLSFSREDLLDFARSQSLEWIEDPSNQTNQYDRNFLRNSIIPLLKQRWPGLTHTLSRSARHCAEAEGLLTADAKILLERCKMSKDRLSRRALQDISAPHQRQVLRAWIKENQMRMPSTRIINRILTETINAADDRNPIVHWPEGEIRRYRDALFLLPTLAGFKLPESQTWGDGERVTLAGDNGRLQLLENHQPGISERLWASQNVTIRYRLGGEGLQLKGRAGTHELKKLFQEVGIPPWIRERTPLIFIGSHLAAVAGFWIAAEFSAKPDERQLSIEWLPPAWIRKHLPNG
jgi:tRNA(Ile)-lysidine synthase